jgi:hypothetical protein
MKATQNKSDVTNRFGDRDFVLAVPLRVSYVNAIVSKLFAIFVRYRMAESISGRCKHRRTKDDVTNRFGDRDFILAVCTCFLCNSDRSAVIRDFRSLNHGGIPFPVDESIAEEN